MYNIHRKCYNNTIFYFLEFFFFEVIQCVKYFFSGCCMDAENKSKNAFNLALAQIFNSQVGLYINCIIWI